MHNKSGPKFCQNLIKIVLEAYLLTIYFDEVVVVLNKLNIFDI